jgi:KDO2-lipid IV(A) lauroyltransferase
VVDRTSDGVRYAPHRRLEAGRLRRLGQRVVERATVLAYRAASRILGTIPLGLSWPVFRGLSLAAYYLWPAKRRAIEANASAILGRPTEDPAVRALARRIYQTYARYIVELMRLPSRPAEELAAMVTDAEAGADTFAAIFERLRAEGRGLICVSCHIGNIEALAAAFAAQGWPAYGLADDTAFPELYDLLQAQRRRWGIEVLGWRNMRGVIRVLRDRSILGLLVDWGYRAEDVPVRLFGSWTTLPAGPAVLAARTRAAILPVVCRRRPDGRFEASHLELIEVPDDRPATIAAATQAVADAVVAMVEPAPEQWYIFKRMWPAGSTEAAALEARAAAMLATEEAPQA